MPALSVDIEALERGGTPVLGPVRLTIAAGETVALVGPSGIGKTSLLRAVAGLGGCVRGRIVASGRLSLVFQEPTLLAWRDVLSNVTIPTGCTGDEARGMLARVGLGGRESDWPATLSLGQQRRLSIARAFAARPDLLLLDEPFVSLDRSLADEMMALVEERLRESGAAALLVTHSLPEAERLASRIVTLAGRPATVASEEIVGVSRHHPPARPEDLRPMGSSDQAGG